MKIRPFLVPLACLSVSLPATADTFVLKDGSRLEAKILKETEDSYQLEVQITKSIRDEKTIAKADVAEIVSEKPDEKAYEAIQSLIPVPDLASADEYTRRIAAVSKFLADHPQSSKTSEAGSILSTLKSELEAVSAGGIKMGGKIITGEEYRADLYDIDAKILEARIREAAGRGDIVGALRGISRMDSDFKSTNSRKAVQPIKKQLLQTYKAQIEEQIATLPTRKAERDASLARMNRDARAVTEQALQEEIDQTDLRFKADLSVDQKWTATHPFHEKSLEKAQEAIEEELQEEEFTPRGDSGRIYRNILKFISGSDDHAAIRDVLFKGEEVEIPEKYMKNLKDAATAKGVTF